MAFPYTYESPEDIQSEMGWTDSTMLVLVMEYIANQQDDAALVEFLKVKAEEENAGCDTAKGAVDD